MHLSPIAHARLQWRRLVRNEHVILGLLALAIGIAAAYGALVFRYAVDFIQIAGFGFSLDEFLLEVAALPWWHIVAVPAVGGLLVGLFTQFVHRGGPPHGVGHVIEASALRGGRMSLRDGLTSTVIHIASLGVGASTGREGPVVHLGATLGAWLSQRLKLSRSQSRTLLGCGVAAATGSLFNAPVAGAVFAIEIVVGNLSLKAAAPIFIASVAGTAIGRFYFGAEPAFSVPALEFISLWEFPAFALLGLVCGVIAVIFMQTIFAFDAAVTKSPLPVWLRPAIGGLAIGAMAVHLPEILGVGYLTASAALHGQLVLSLLLALIAGKIVAVAISIGFGFGGGVFSPSLFLGAMVGGSYGIIAGSVFPELFSGVAAYALIGTAALAGAVMGAPLTAIFIIFELTGSSAMTIAVMIATAIASVSTSEFYARSFFHRQLRRRGIIVEGGHDQALLRSMSVSDVMRRDYVTIAPTASIDAVHTRLHGAPDGEVYVVDEESRILGVIHYPDVDLAAIEASDHKLETASDVGYVVPGLLTPEDSLEEAQRLLAASGSGIVPVVRARDNPVLCGIIGELDVSRAYNRALLRVRADEHA